MMSRLAAVLATLSIPAVLGLTAIAAHAAPCGADEVRCLTDQLHRARAHQAQHKAHAALVKAHQRAWIADCVAERTGPEAGLPAAEARAICLAEAPTLDTLRTDPTAWAPAAMISAQTACAQRLTDACVAAAASDGSTDCDVADGLQAAYRQVCLGGRAAPIATHPPTAHRGR